MIKKIIGIFALVVFLIGIVVTLYAGEPCRDYFSKCTEGGCGTLISAVDCKMKCHGDNITCGIPEIPNE
jgi:glucose uptake protein GlcU